MAAKQVTQMSRDEWFDYMAVLAANPKQWPSTLGIALRHALLRAPSCWGSSSRRQRMQVLSAFLSPEGAAAIKKDHGDLLPLPHDLSDEDEAWDEKA